MIRFSLPDRDDISPEIRIVFDPAAAAVIGAFAGAMADPTPAKWRQVEVAAGRIVLLAQMRKDAARAEGERR